MWGNFFEILSMSKTYWFCHTAWGQEHKFLKTITITQHSDSKFNFKVNGIGPNRIQVTSTELYRLQGVILYFAVNFVQKSLYFLWDQKLKCFKSWHRPVKLIADLISNSMKLIPIKSKSLAPSYSGYKCHLVLCREKSSKILILPMGRKIKVDSNDVLVTLSDSHC